MTGAKYQTLIKFGGSITEKGTLSQIMVLGESLSKLYQKEQSFLIVPGGGAFAETIRQLQKKYQLTNETAHWMAILAMDQHGFLLKQVIPNAKIIATEELITRRVQAPLTEVPILSIYAFLKKFSKLEHSWKVTSDALSVEIAISLKMSQIIFLKDVDGLLQQGKLVKRVSFENVKTLKHTLFDQKAIELAEQHYLPIKIVNGFYPERLEKALANKTFIGTEIYCNKNHKT